MKIYLLDQVVRTGLPRNTMGVRMSKSQRYPRNWEFRVLGRFLFHLPRRVIYLTVLGLSIGTGLHSPSDVLNFAEGAVQKLLRELHEWRALADGIVRRLVPS